MKILSVGQAFPPHYYDQEVLLGALRTHWATRHHNLARLERMHRAVMVGGRHLALPLERYPTLATFSEANDAWIEVAQAIGEAAVRDALDRAGVPIERVGAFFFTTVTGLATPSIDARLMNRIPELPRHVKRVPLFGLGCVAGAAGIARAADYVRAFPDQVALVLSVELCSLTLQREDLSVPNLISSGLFGDGAACAVVAGANVPGDGPQVQATRSVFYPDTERVMGWDIGERGFKIVLDKSVPQVVEANLRADVDSFLADNQITLGDIGSYVCHPGGPKVLDAFEAALDLDAEALALTRRSLQAVGNLSSASVLMVLRDTMAEARPKSGTRGLLMALGPAFCAELVLLRW